MSGKKRKNYTPECRRGAAHLAIERSRLDDPPAALDVDECAELDRLRVEVSELRMDREFRTKATAFFVSEHTPVEAFQVLDAAGTPNARPDSPSVPG